MNIIRLQGNVEKKTGIYYEYDADSKPLGEGGMGRVYKGYRVVERTGERIPVAVKAIYENIPELVVERARREANIQLDNDNLIRMYGFVETITQLEGDVKFRVSYHVIMELLVGVTLEDIINGITSDQNGMLIPYAAELYSQYTQNRYSTVVKIMKSILSGLMALHDSGFIHRDIDPSNIMVTIDGKIKLIDFGICKQIVSLESLDKSLTATGVFMGKVNYAAPELVLGDVRSQNCTTDIYALGILLYQLCTGHLPFTGTDQDILSSNMRKSLPMHDVRRKDFKKIIRKATEKAQSKRYASVAEFRVDLDRLVLDDGKKHGGKVGLAAGIVVLLSAGLTIFYSNRSAEVAVDNLPIMQELSCEDKYSDALAMLNQKDSIHLQTQGKEQLRILAEDSLYVPAMTKYYVILLNSNNPADVKKGFAELHEIAESDSTNSVAMFECGLTLSQSNKVFNVPIIRQSFLGIEPDLLQANEMLYKSMELDTLDYKSVYWAFNNLLELKLDGALSTRGDKEIVRLYKLFEHRIKEHEDNTADIYRSAIVSDGKTLRAWGLIK